MERLKSLSPTAYVPIGAAVILMLVSCYVQGKWSERWETFPELQIYADQLKEIPKEIGEWEGTDAAKTDEKILKIAGAAGEMVRTYRNASGEEVRVSIICARLNDVFYHTPDRCYPAAGFEMQGEPQSKVFEIGDKTAEFFSTSFLKQEPTGTHAEVGYWSWSADGSWVAPKNYKLEFAGEKALYKLYVFATVPATGKMEHDFCGDFIKAFVPRVETALRPAIERAARLRAGDESAAAPAPLPSVETEAKDNKEA